MSRFFRLSDFNIAVAIGHLPNDQSLWNEAFDRARPHIRRLAQVTTSTAIPHSHVDGYSPLESEIIGAFYKCFPKKPKTNFTFERYVRKILDRHLIRVRAAMRNNPYGILPDDLSRVVPLIERRLRKIQRKGLPLDPDAIAAKVNNHRRAISRLQKTSAPSNKRDEHDISGEHVRSYLALRGIHSLDLPASPDDPDLTFADLIEQPEQHDEVLGVEEVVFNVLASTLSKLQGRVMLAAAMEPEKTEVELAIDLGVSIAAIRQAKKDARSKWRETLGGRDGLLAFIEYVTAERVVTP